MKTLSYDALMLKPFKIEKVSTLQEELRNYILIILLNDNTIAEYCAEDETLDVYKNWRKYTEATGMHKEDFNSCDKLLSISPKEDKNYGRRIQSFIHLLFAKHPAHPSGQVTVKDIRIMHN